MRHNMNLALLCLAVFASVSPQLPAGRVYRSYKPGQRPLPSSPPRKTAVATFISSDSGSGVGNFVLKIDGKVRSLFWDRGTQFNNFADYRRAYTTGAEWKIVYSEARNIDSDPYLWGVTFTGKILSTSSSTPNSVSSNPAKPLSPSDAPRLIVVLFTGFDNRVDVASGMKTLLNSIKKDRDLNNVIGNVFTFYDPTRGFSPTAPWISTLRNFRLPHETAVNWVLDQRPHPQDKIVLIGHSYGGNRARLFGGDLLLKGLRATALITIDAVDWERCTVRSFIPPSAWSEDCFQSSLQLPPPGNIPIANQLSFAQTSDLKIRGYGIKKPVIVVKGEDHSSIDDAEQVHQQIREFLVRLLSESKSAAPDEMVGTLWKIENDVCGQNMWSYYSLITFLPDGRLRESSGSWRITGNQLVIDGAKNLNIEQMKLTLQGNQMKGKANLGQLPGQLRPEEACVRLVKLTPSSPPSSATAAIPKSGIIEGTVIATIDGPSTGSVVVESKGLAYELLLVSRTHEAKIVGDDVRVFGTRVRATYIGLTKLGVGGYEGRAIRVVKLSSPTQLAQPDAPNSPKQSIGQTHKAGVRDTFKGVLKPQSDSPAPNKPPTSGTGYNQLPSPYEDLGACPFECCTYRRWTVTTQTSVRQDRQSSSPVAFTLRRGERVTGMTGIVITTQPGQARALKPTTIGGVRVGAGEIIYVLTNLGEGHSKVWYKGRLGEAEIYDITLFKILKEPQSIWWVKVKNGKGQVGWTDQTKNFTGMDACG